MDSAQWSVFAAFLSLLSAACFAIDQRLRDKRQRAFELYDLWDRLSLIDDPKHNTQCFNLINFTARLVKHNHISREVFIDLLGSTYLQLVDLMRSRGFLNKDNPATNIQVLLNSPRYKVIIDLYDTVKDSLLDKESIDDCLTC